MQVLLDEVKHSWLSADESEQLSSRFLKSLVSDDLMKDGFFREGLYAFFTQEGVDCKYQPKTYSGFQGREEYPSTFRLERTIDYIPPGPLFK